MLKGIDSGIKDRAGLVNYVKNYDGQGLARHYKWDSTGELASALIWVYQVK
jgi:branched-chain amino acid transport system substrate-binding protein